MHSDDGKEGEEGLKTDGLMILIPQLHHVVDNFASNKEIPSMIRFTHSRNTLCLLALLFLAAALAATPVAYAADGGAHTDANNGEAFGGGTTAYMFWPTAGVPSGSIGFVVARSLTPNEEDFYQISGLLDLETYSYEDQGLSPGTYYYAVVVVDSSYNYSLWGGVWPVTITGE
jgi:hypothetical protein